MDRRPKKKRGKGELSARDARGWVARSALAMGLLVLGGFGTANSLAHVVVKVDPARAHSMAPGDGTILARLAQDTFRAQPNMRIESGSAILARRALLSDPMAVEALTVLGFQARLRGETARADQIFGYSSELSRRELRPRIWAIEAAVTRGDIAGALRNYDIALRTSRDASDSLFPTLTSALSEPRIRSELLGILKTRPVWGENFISYAAHSGIEPEGTIALLSEARGSGFKVTNDLRASLVNTLMSQDKPDRAWAYYRSFRPDARRERSRDAEFALQSDRRAVFDWQVGKDPRLAAAILTEGKAGLLDFAVSPSAGGELVRQTQLLPAGSYRLVGRSRGVKQPERSQPYWTLTCLDGRELGRTTVPNSQERGGDFSGWFIVPEDCKIQILSLVARPSDNIMGVTGQIERVQLVPLKGST